MPTMLRRRMVSGVVVVIDLAFDPYLLQIMLGLTNPQGQGHFMTRVRGGEEGLQLVGSKVCLNANALGVLHGLPACDDGVVLDGDQQIAQSQAQPREIERHLVEGQGVPRSVFGELYVGLVSDRQHFNLHKSKTRRLHVHHHPEAVGSLYFCFHTLENRPKELGSRFLFVDHG